MTFLGVTGARALNMSKVIQGHNVSKVIHINVQTRDFFFATNFVNGNPNKIVSCAVYLEDTNKENGCLRLVEGSNTKGIFPHDIESGIPYVKWIDDKLLEDYNIIDLELKAPYAVFFDINMVHGCYPNKSDSTRFSLAWEYIETSNMDVQMSDEPWCDRNTIS